MVGRVCARMAGGMMARSFVVSAPGKIILHGEHAVVYNKAALATSVNLRCYHILTPTQDRKITLHLPDFVPNSALKKSWNVEELESALTERGTNWDHEKLLCIVKKLAGLEENETPSILKTATLVFLYLLVGIYDGLLKEMSGLSSTVISELPAGAGLGSSAAYSVCLAAGFLTSCGTISAIPSPNVVSSGLPCDTSTKIEANGIELATNIRSETWNKNDMELINKWGVEAEMLVHGTPSGIDNSISTYGGAIRYQSGGIEHIEYVIIPIGSDPFSTHPSMPRIRILLINTKVPRSTKKMVAGVKERYEKFISVVSPILDSIDNITSTAQKLLQQLSDQQSSDNYEDREIHSQLEELFLLNQHLLNALGVGHPAIDKVCNLGESKGLKAKLTGGGGGGCVIALVPPGLLDDKLFEVETLFHDAGFECWETVVGCEGVKLHPIKNVK